MIRWQALIVFVFFFLIVAALGFYAKRWRKGDMSSLSEWGLGGRTFGVIITWFLVGSDLYTAYTVIALPALVYGKGAMGMFALPYTIILYPLMLAVMPKLWQVAKNRGHITASDYVKERFESRALALLVAITGIIAIIPYIALQMYGMEVVLSFMGAPSKIALVIAFLVLAVFTFNSGLRAPTLIAFVKDFLVYSAFIAAVIYIPMKLGGYSALFSDISPTKLILQPDQYVGYSTLMFGSALSIFLYPHAITAVLGSKSRKTVKTNMSVLPIYTFLLGIIALLGFMAIAMGIRASGTYGANGVVPKMLIDMFPAPFVGYAFAAIGVGALVPASIMSIGAANLFSRNVYQEFFRPRASGAESTIVAKIVSIVILVAALAFILVVPSQYAINFQLAGGDWILQTVPSVYLALFVRWLDRRAIMAGWVVGIGWASFQLVQEGFSSSLHTLHFLGGADVYIGLSALIANVIVVVVGSLLIRLVGAQHAYKLLSDKDYEEPE